MLQKVKTLDRKKRLASRKASSRRGDISRQLSQRSGGSHVTGLSTEEEQWRRLQSIKALTGSLDSKRRARLVFLLYAWFIRRTFNAGYDLTEWKAADCLN